jgi:putative hydroxymethylpyrimidine transport system substrate-binding protein
MRLRGRLLIALVTVVALAAACGDDGDGGTATGGGEGGGQPTAVRIVTEWSYPDPLWIPFLVAEDQGYYEAAGLEVSIQAPPDNSTTMKMLAADQAQVGLSAITDVVFARGEDLPVVSVANMTVRNNWGLFALGEGPIDLGALAGKKIGIYNDSWTAAMLPLMLRPAGLTMDDVETVAATGSVIPLLLDGKIDVATEVTNLGGVEITTSSGEAPQILLAPEVGAPDTPVWVYVANSEWAAANAGLVTAWLDATRRGSEWAIENPEEAVALFEEAYPETASAHEYNLAAWYATQPLLSDNEEWFTQSDGQWSDFTAALVEADQLDAALSPAEYYTNDYLP